MSKRTEEVAGFTPAASFWACPCGSDRPEGPRRARPVETRVSLREPRCGFCGGKFKPEYQRSAKSSRTEGKGIA